MRALKQSWLAAMGVLLMLALYATPPRLAAQVKQEKPKHHHYKLIDLGTLGGPTAYTSLSAPGYPIINNAGVVSASANTAAPDPFAPACFNVDCFVTHATRWKNGVLTDLGALPGPGNSSAVSSINARGWSVGASEGGAIDPLLGGPAAHATLWKNDDIMDLGGPIGHGSIALASNDAGEVVGFATNTTPDPFSIFPVGTQSRAFLWREGEFLDLGTLGGPDAQALSINELGQVAGIAYTSFVPNDDTGIPTTHPFVWHEGKMRDLGTLGGTYAGPGSCAFGVTVCVTPVFPPFEGSLLVNNRGQVIGTSNLAGDQIFHPFLWEDGRMKDLGTLGGDNGVAIWVTEAGEVVGDADLPDNPPGCIGLACIHHAFLWKDGAMTDLGTLGTDPCSRAVMMNSKGQIVGSTISVCGNIETQAFLWEDGGPMVALDSLISTNSGVHLWEGDNINERGEIIASGLLNGGCNDREFCGHVFLLIPCDRDHPGLEGCDYSPFDPTTQTSTPSAIAVQPKLASAGAKDRARAMLTNRNRRLGVTPRQ